MVDPFGNPVSGIPVTLTSTECSVTSPDGYYLPSTDGDGTTTTSVPYGTYSYTDTVAGQGNAHTNITLTVGPTSVVETVGGTSTTFDLPTTVQVPE